MHLVLILLSIPNRSTVIRALYAQISAFLTNNLSFLHDKIVVHSGSTPWLNLNVINILSRDGHSSLTQINLELKILRANCIANARLMKHRLTDTSQPQVLQLEYGYHLDQPSCPMLVHRNYSWLPLP